jgi:hypothetical protein
MINCQLPPEFPQLNGTSTSAIEAWYAQLSACCIDDLPFWAGLCELLKHTGKRLRLHSDASHRAYAEESLSGQDETSVLVGEVETLVRSQSLRRNHYSTDS